MFNKSSKEWLLDWPVVCKKLSNSCKLVLVSAAAHFVSRDCILLYRLLFPIWDLLKARKKSLGQIKALGVSFHMERLICVWVYDSGLFLYYRESSVWIMAATISQSSQNPKSSLCRHMCEPVFTLHAVKMRKRETKRLKTEGKIE